MKEKTKVIKVFLAFSTIAMLILTSCGAATTGGGTPTPTPVTESGGISEEGPTPTPIPDVTEEPTTPGIVYVPGGRFLMGSTEEDPDAWTDEFPQHTVALPGFWIFTREVTNYMYQGCIDSGACTEPENQTDGAAAFFHDPAYADHPVVGVTWEQAAAFCDAMQARLPTEAEWEKAARGIHGQIYPWGDDPASCSLANLEGCIEDTGTEPVGILGGGASPYDALDMSGNVNEWVFDWYGEGYYAESPNIEPTGPATGQYRVARGGGYTETGDQARAASRFAYPPDQGFENVGFRCVPVPLAQIQAPFCRDTYIPFCEPTNTQDGGCQEGEQPNSGGSEGGVSITGISCPQGNSIRIYIDVGEENVGATGVTINGNSYDCSPLPEVPGRILCTGPAIVSGGTMEVVVCPAQAGVNNSHRLACAPSAAASVSLPVDYDQLLVAFMAVVQPAVELQTVVTTGNNCGEGYEFNPQTGGCDRVQQDPCPEGWTATMATAGCQPNDNGDCPQGTTYVVGAGCQPSTGSECPEGYYFTANQTCEPNINQRTPACPVGYYFNQSSNCCTPLRGNNYDCPQGYYFSENANACLPQTMDGCPYGYFYDPFTGCVPDMTQGGSTPPATGVTGAQECPEGLVLNQEMTACVPPGQTGIAGVPGYTDCPPGFYRDNYQNCVPEDSYNNPQCGEGQYYDTYYQICVDNGDSDCPPGNYTNAFATTCTPNTGPNSPCPVGYSLSRLGNCCVPNPGTDGSTCPDGQTATGGQTPGLLVTAYNPYGGYCDPEPGSPCPQGYFLNNEQVCEPIPTVPQDGCPEGTTEVITQSVAAMVTICVPNQTGDCPEGYYLDTSQNACLPQNDQYQIPQCAQNQYYDRQLGYCVQRNGDCCQQGFYFNVATGACVPGPSQEGDAFCPPGQFTTAAAANCVPYGTPGGGGSTGCVTIQTSMPYCDGPCLYPLAWDPQTQSCVENVVTSDPCVGLGMKACFNLSNVCYWDTGAGICVHN